MTLIAHLDLDAFFASVEMRLRPVLARRPVVVAGLGARAVVAAASYPARTFGVRSGQPLFSARERCPELVVVAPRFAAYQEVSSRVFAAVSSLASVVEVLGVDEAFAVPSYESAGSGCDAAAALRWAARVRDLVNAAVGVPLSVGLADSKVAAKLCSRRAKPDGVFLLEPGDASAFLLGVPLSEVPGVGPRTLELLDALGATVVGDLLAVPPSVLSTRLGPALSSWLLQVARNADDRPVVPAGRSVQVGVSRTFEHDLVGGAPSKVFNEVFDEVLADALRRLSRDGRGASGVTVRFGRPDGSSVSASSRLDSPTRDVRLLAQAARGLSARAPSGPLRLLGVSFTGLADAEQLLLEGLLDAPPFVLPEVGALSLLDRAFYGMPVRHDAFGDGVLLSVLEPEPLPVLSGDLYCRVRFDRERVVLSSRLVPVGLSPLP